MGDIADMMLDGTLDEETGEYIGDHNKERYGTESPGFPVSLERERREGRKRGTKYLPGYSTPHGNKKQCSLCRKWVKIAGIKDHMRDVHGHE